MTESEFALLYHLLSTSFSYPDVCFAEHLKVFVGGLRVGSWQEGENGAADLPFASFIREVARLGRQGVESLQREYTWLFTAGDPVSLCPICERAYRADLGTEHMTQALHRAYAAWGLSVPVDLTDRVDVELAFVAFLCGRSADDEGVGTASRMARHAFLHAHLLAWMPQFAASVVANTRHGFYREAAHLLTRLLEIEAGTQYQPVGKPFQ